MQNDNSKFKIIFFGGPKYTAPVLEALIHAGYNIVAVVTVPDEQTGRKKIMMPPAIKTFALKNNLKLFQPGKLKENNELVSCLLSLAPDLGIVAAYSKIIPQKYLDISKFGFLNIHPSLLPKYRGPSPIKTAILNGDKETGVTIMLVDEEMDHGQIVANKKYLVDSVKYHKEIENDLWNLGIKLLIKTLPKYVNGEIKTQEQDHSQATFTKKFSREDGRIDWSRPAEKIYNQIRALSSESGTWTKWKDKILNIQKVDLGVQLLSNFGVELLSPGMVINVDNRVAVVTGKCYLILKMIQFEGKKETDAKSFVNGHPDFINSRLE